jgi:hypothetical protein
MQFALLPQVLRKTECTLCTAQTTLTVSFGPD